MRSKLAMTALGSIAAAILPLALTAPAYADTYTSVDRGDGVILWIDDQTRDFHGQGFDLHAGDQVAVFIDTGSGVFEATSATAGAPEDGLNTPPYHAAIGDYVQACVLLPSDARCTGWNQFNG